MRVVRELELVVNQRGRPHTIVSDNGTELTSNAVLRWAADRVIWHYIQPGKPTQNAFIEWTCPAHEGTKSRLLMLRFFPSVLF